ncbi:MAG: transcription-repair coupling factor [Deltaproteobacteria bacterium]|nr:transcription-repair coupling factor [Deltaproteobacteria bacterium]MCL5879759.1 transcription-repair coupling factor [Deltaproteobacteria bacterium]
MNLDLNLDLKNNVCEGRGLKKGAGAAFALEEAFLLDSENNLSIFLCDNYLSARDLYKNLTFFENALFLAGSLLKKKKVFFCEEIIPLSLLYEIKTEKDAIIILTPASFFSKVPELDILSKSCINVKRGLKFSRDKFISALISYGYELTSQIENQKEFAVRGEIIDIAGAENSPPVRIDFFDEIVEDIRYFDINTQRSFKNIDGFTVFPVKEGVYEKKLNLLDIVPSPVLYIEKPKTELQNFLNRDAGNRTIYEEASKKACKLFYYDIGELKAYTGSGSFENSENAYTKIEGFNDINFIKNFKYKNGQLNLKLIKKVFSGLTLKKYLIILVSKNEIHHQRLKEIFASVQLDNDKTEGRFHIVIGEISAGIISKKHKLLIFTGEELFREHVNLIEEPLHKGSKPDFFNEISELNPGDFAVHDEFGVARFTGIKKITVSGTTSDYFELLYEGGDKVFVPADKIYLIHKYIASSEENSPKLSRLGNKSWERAKIKAKEKIEEVVEDLKVLYAKRMTERGFAFSEEDEVYREFEESFEFEETEDQAKAIKDVLSDMHLNKPMDRLICGDVGFGKTEVAIRAAFKASMDGKQVALIAPTTLLVEQHYNNFKKRFEKYPLKVAYISRFVGKGEEKKILNQIKSGEIDIIIGTHKLLSEKIKFHDIGLLIIDEEQKFGALQKERIKEIRSSIDVLAMSATPIPRTLYLSMSGIRDLSIIDTPPAGRKNVITDIADYDDEIIKDAVFKELSRGGQVYFIDNRISHLDGIFKKIKKIMPDIRIGVVHGRLGANDIEQAMHLFYNKGYDMLLSTSIIESGLDNPNVNTIIINNAENLGLSQLYQLRGRVGRSHLQAYCLLVIGCGLANLTEEQRKRLDKVKEYSELGAGFKLAMADLEIRGAGNILGGAQSGHIDAVGLEMCMQMLKEEVEKMQGITLPPQINPEVKTSLSLYIPDSYINDSKIKLSFYRKLANCNSLDDVSAVRIEFADRFGKIPPIVDNLLQVEELKVYMKNARVKLLEIKENEFIIEFHGSAEALSDVLIRFVNDRNISSEYAINFLGEFIIKFRPKKDLKPLDKLGASKIILQRLYSYVNI